MLTNKKGRQKYKNMCFDLTNDRYFQSCQRYSFLPRSNRYNLAKSTKNEHNYVVAAAAKTLRKFIYTSSSRRRSRTYEQQRTQQEAHLNIYFLWDAGWFLFLYRGAVFRNSFSQCYTYYINMKTVHTIYENKKIWIYVGHHTIRVSSILFYTYKNDVVCWFFVAWLTLGGALRTSYYNLTLFVVW